MFEVVQTSVRAVATTLFIAIAGCVSASVAHADLLYQETIHGTCLPGTASTIRIIGWRPGSLCNNDCFTWRLTCSDGRVFRVKSENNPWTTTWQSLFYSTAPWSFAVYLAPFALVLIIAFRAAGTPILALDLLICLYVFLAGYRFYVTVNSNPWERFGSLYDAILLNPYVYFAVLAVFVLSNIPAVFRTIDFLFIPHRAGETIGSALQSEQPIDVVAASAALMPDFCEFIEPSKPAYYYRRQAEKALALKKQLEADAELAEAVIRRERARRKLNDQL